jgi:hypothetical protein
MHRLLRLWNASSAVSVLEDVIAGVVAVATVATAEIAVASAAAETVVKQRCASALRRESRRLERARSQASI